MESVIPDPRFVARRSARERWIAAQASALREQRLHLEDLSRQLGKDPTVTSARLIKVSERIAQAEQAHREAVEELKTFEISQKEQSNV